MPIIWTTICFWLGILAADRLDWPLVAWLIFGLLSAVSGLGLGMLRKARGSPLLLAALILGLSGIFFLGGARYQISLPDLDDPDHIIHYSDSQPYLELTGLVDSYPDTREQKTQLQLLVESVSLAEEDPLPASGKVLVRIPAEYPVEYGDRIRVSGYLRLPESGEDFDYRTYLMRKGIHVLLNSSSLQILESEAGGNPTLGWIYKLRTRSLERIYLLWPDPEASLLAGILLGIESGISDDVSRAFRETGTTHIIAISGFNITIVAGLFTRSLKGLLGPHRAGLGAVIGILFYTILVGGDPAVVRAAVMGALSIFARGLGRRQHGLNAAALASLIMFLGNPQLPWDISFQLSLGATLGLILYAEPLEKAFLRFSSRFLSQGRAERLAGPVSEYFLMTIAAQLTTLPVMLHHFRSYSTSALIANPLILPAQPPIMVLGGIALILSLISFPLGQAAAPAVFPFVLFTIRIVEMVSRLPIRLGQTGPVGWGWLTLYYAWLVLLTHGGGLLAYIRREIKIGTALAGLTLLLTLTWRQVLSMPDGYTHLHLLDVGTGSALYLQTPAGKRIMINGGPSTRRLSDQLGRLLPPFQRSLDYWIIASPTVQDLDGIAGNITRFRPEMVLWLGEGSLCWEAEHLRALLAENEIEIQAGEAGQVLDLDGEVQIQVLAEGRVGGSLLIENDSLRVLLPFGLTETDRAALRHGQDLGQVSVLLLADNGYGSSNPARWINHLQPQLALLSLGVKDSRELPDRVTLDRLAGYSLLRTDQQGKVHLISDGEQLWIQVERPP